MSKLKIYSRNIAANFSGYAINLLVSFFLMPFIIHKLGNSAYGIWTLLMSLTGYLGLLEIGVMSATGRYINYYLGREDSHGVSYVVNTSLFFFSIMGLLLLAISVIGSSSFQYFFPKMSEHFSPEFQFVLPILAANIILGLLAATFRQLLISNDRFDIQNLIDLVVLTCRTGGIVFTLSAGGGLVSLAVVHSCVSLLGLFLLLGFARWRGPHVCFGFRYVSFKTFEVLFHFGIFAFIGDIGTQLIYYTDTIVIGILIGAEGITFYNIGFVFVDYGRKLIEQGARVFLPDILKAGGRNDCSELRLLLIKVIRISMFLGIPLFIGFLTLGNEFIELWMGAEYIASASILSILSISHLGALTARSCLFVLLGLGKIRVRASIGVVEACLNLILSVVLVKLFDLGINGVALGTMIPMLIVSGLILPAYTCKLLGFGIREFIKATLFKGGVAICLFSVACFAAAQLPLAISWCVFWAKALVLVVLYLIIGYFILLDCGEREKLSHANIRMRKTLLSWCGMNKDIPRRN